MAEGGKGQNSRAVIAALLANLGIAVAKFVGFLLTGASSMLAEAFHSVADSGNQATLIVGGRVAERAPDRQHPFGHGRARFFAAFLVAVILFTLGSLFSLYEGYEKLRHPHELESAGVALVILLVALVLEGLSLRTAVREATPLRGDQSWWSFIRTTKKPELAAVLRFEMYSLLVGEAASPAEQAAIREAILSTDGVAKLLALRTMHLGPDDLLVVGGLEIERARSAADTAAVIDAAQARVREALPSARVIYLEPDLPAAVPEAS